MANKLQKMLDDVRYVFAEDQRLRKIGIKEAFKEPFDALSLMSHGNIWTSKDARSRIWELAEVLGKRSGLAARVEQSTLYRVVTDSIIVPLYRHREDLDLSKVDRAMSHAVKRLREQCIDRVHFIPCHLMWGKEAARLTIGPVTFHNRKSFRQLMLSKRDFQVSSDADGQRETGRKLLTEAIRFYRKFMWIAEVEVKGFDAEASKKAAERAVISALDCLHLYFGPNASAKMQIGGPATHMERRASLCLNEAGELWPETTATSIGQVNFGEGWSKSIEREDAVRLFELFAIALETAINPDLKRPLCRRFLEAAQWFGEAVRDERASTSVVKYVMALERMFMTEADKCKYDSGDEKITPNLANRVAAICFDPEKPGDRGEWSRKVSKAYDLRSKLVHGSMSPLDQAAEMNRWSIGKLVGFALLRTLDAFGAKGMRTDDLKDAQLRDWFNKTVVWADGVERDKHGHDT